MRSAFARARSTNAKGARVHQIPAPRRVTLQPEQFTSEWPGRPREAVVFGLRLPAEKDFEGAGVEARRQVKAMSLPDAEVDDAIELAFSRVLVARALCDPDNVTAAHPVLPLADDQVARAFPPLVIKNLFLAVHKLHVEQSPGYGEADDIEITRLVEILCLDDPFHRLAPDKEARVRRYLAFVLEELESD